MSETEKDLDKFLYGDGKLRAIELLFLLFFIFIFQEFAANEENKEEDEAELAVVEEEEEEEDDYEIILDSSKLPTSNAVNNVNNDLNK